MISTINFVLLIKKLRSLISYSWVLFLAEELQAIPLIGVEGGVHGNFSIFSTLQGSITPEWYPNQEEYKVSP